MTLSVGARLGPYEILGPLGAGGMGEVYRARDARLDREVAIKVLSERTAEDPAALSRFEREAKAVAALSHPNILAIHDFAREGGIAYAVTELLEGETVTDRLLQGPIPWRRAAEIGVAVAEGLSAAHARGIMHRDLKPQNLFLTTDDRVKILDFGLARREQVVSAEEQTSAPTQTGTVPGTVLGTVGYMSPEQVRGDPTDVRTDIFSLGCVLYEMVTGKRAFRRRTAADTMAAILNQEPAEAPASELGAPPTLHRIIGRCLQKNPESRFQSARDLAFALREALSGSAASVAAAPTTEVAKPRGSRFWIDVVGIAAAAMLALALGLNLGGLRQRLIGRRAIASLVVLPLANRSGDPQQDYFVDGMTDELITRLAKLGNLRVISRTSAMSYRDTKKSLPEIARELNVDAVVEGSVARTGSKIKVNAELIQAASDKPLWADSYERDVADIISLQGEIAGAIARKVEIALTPDERARLETKRRVDPQAYEAYVKGRYFFNKGSEPNLKKAAEEFQRALDIDPTYAAAYAGLADAYSVIGYQTYVSPLDVAPKAKAAAAKALELDASLASPHASLGYIHLYFDWDFAASESEFQRAIALDPNSETAHRWYSLLLTAVLRPSEARREIERARALDPLSASVAWVAGGELFYGGQYEAAIKALRDAIAMDSKNGVAHFWLGRTFQAQGKNAEAIAEYRAAEPQVSQFPPSFAALGYFYGISGKRMEALTVLADLDRMSKERYISPFCWAMVYLGLGEHDKALAYLNRSLEERTTWLVWILNDPRFDPLRGDPRFQEVLRRMGFPADALARARRAAA